MANTLVRIEKRRKYIIDENAKWKITKIVGVPPRLVLTDRDKVLIYVNKSEVGLFIGRHGVTVKRLEEELGTSVKIIGVDEDVDILVSPKFI